MFFSLPYAEVGFKILCLLFYKTPRDIERKKERKKGMYYYYYYYYYYLHSTYIYSTISAPWTEHWIYHLAAKC